MAQAYTKLQGFLHWGMAPALTGSILCVLKAQEYDWKTSPEPKGVWMWRHKSLGLLTGMLAVPRIITKVISPAVAALPGNSAMFNKLAKVSHLSLYGFMIMMATTGISMGYFGGKGLPFFVTKFDGGKENKFIADWSYKIHTFTGHYFKYIVPIHIGAASMHAVKGQAIFARINPFRKLK